MKPEGEILARDRPRLELRRFAVYRAGIRLLPEFDLSLGVGASVALVGANGSGKSAFVKALAGVLNSKGDVFLDGELTQINNPERVLRAGIALCPANRRLFPRLTVEENLLVGGYILRGRLRRTRVQEQLDRFPNLGRRRLLLAGQLSGGEQQQLAVARALMVRPRLLLLDEPSRGLSPAAISILLETVQALTKEGVTVMLVDQSVEWLCGRVDRLLVIADGRLIADSTSGTSTMEELAKAYFVL